MIVYFEDGPLVKESPIPYKNHFKIDAGMGYSICRAGLWNISKNFPFDTKVYTNSLDAFSNTWCWDEENKMPMIYVRDGNHQWRLISELTDRELRRGLNLEKLYVGGEFIK